MTTLESLVGGILDVGEEHITDDTGPATTGDWTSLRHVQIVAAVEDTYGVRLTPREARTVRSVGALRSVLKAKGLDV